MFTRRQFIKALACGITASAMPALVGARADSTSASTLTISPGHSIGRIPANYIGLSYESAQLGQPNFLSPSNANLIAFIRRLGRDGVLRIGGNTSEFTIWSPGQAADTSSVAVPPDTGHGVRVPTHVTTDAIDNLAGFVDAIGWKLIYGLNLGHGTAEEAAEEARYVAQAVGRNLLALQIGNEPDLYHHNHLRPRDWGFDDYWKEWQTFADAIRQKNPDAPLAGPDVAGGSDWIESFAQQARGKVGLLTGHYYAEGPPTNPDMNIDRLLSPNPRLVDSMTRAVAGAEKSGLPFRMAECNSCYNGGKDGVSNTLAAALWGGDYMLQIAQEGCSGVNFHGGGNGYYTPISGSIETTFIARPLYYGMLLAGQFAGATLVQSAFDQPPPNVTAYAAVAGRRTLVALFNKDAAQSIDVTVDTGGHVGEGRLWRLTGPSLDSKGGVTLAGDAVYPDGSWSPLGEEPITPQGGRVTINLPAGSAALAFLD